ncbi:MAG: peptidoglycan D,D-transpeptidase FtsI family protein [Gammaproteobacteria bacterium]
MTPPRYFVPPRLRISAVRLVCFFCALAAAPVVMMVGGIWRLHDLHPQLQGEIKKIYEMRRVIPSHHGTITDRRGMPLAMSANLYHAAADPRLLQKANPGHLRDIAQAVAAVLGLDAEAVYQKINGASAFVSLKKKVPPVEAAKLRAMNIKGLFASYDSSRFYPGREMAAPLVGYVNDKGYGQGVEFMMAKRLGAEDGEVHAARTSKGSVVKEFSLRPAKHGGVLKLAIDSRLQAAAYNAAVRALRKHNARAVSAAVMDAQNGDILALASAPSFNPNNIQSGDLRGGREVTKNRVIADLVECGSLAKPFVVALALELQLAQEDEILPTATAVRVGVLRVRDSHIREDVSVAEVLTRSSNIGAYLLARRVGEKHYYDFLRAVGFGGGKTILGLHGEAGGAVRHYSKWRREDFATHAYGYGFNATLLELLRAYSVFATDGFLLQPQLSPGGEVVRQRVLSAQTARRVRNIMSGVTEGTAKMASVPGYKIAGKTGTAKKFVNGAYSDTLKRAFFVGMAPAAKPRYVIAVMVDEPRKNGESGGTSAAPVFSDIMRRALVINGIAPYGEKQGENQGNNQGEDGNAV